MIRLTSLSILSKKKGFSAYLIITFILLPLLHGNKHFWNAQRPHEIKQPAAVEELHYLSDFVIVCRNVEKLEQKSCKAHSSVLLVGCSVTCAKALRMRWQTFVRLGNVLIFWSPIYVWDVEKTFEVSSRLVQFCCFNLKTVLEAEALLFGGNGLQLKGSMGLQIYDDVIQSFYCRLFCPNWPWYSIISCLAPVLSWQIGIHFLYWWFV